MQEIGKLLRRSMEIGIKRGVWSSLSCARHLGIEKSALQSVVRAYLLEEVTLEAGFQGASLRSQVGEV